jgi:hypothetical protein
MDRYTKLVLQQDRADADQDVSVTDKDWQHQMNVSYELTRIAL